MIVFAEGLIELGAQWVHGNKGNPLFTLLNSLGQIDASYDCD